MMTQNIFVPEYDLTIENNYRKQANFDGKIAVLDILGTFAGANTIIMHTYSI